MLSDATQPEPTIRPANEPIAIIGMGCRLPGNVHSPDQLWDLLSSGRDVVSEVPEDRWRQYDQPGTASAAALRRTTRRGGFLADAAGFDAGFFGITPREAELMDPQQRIMLEATWEALDDAGVPALDLAGSATGVFVGVGSDDYGRQMLEDLPRIEAWSGIGAAYCAVANRVSYVLDLRGPSLAVDTACSSSLVAVHLACQSLGAGESMLALAAGVNLIAGPGLTMVLDAAGATSPSGQSKPFDAAADGYGRGEGIGVLVLKQLRDAVRDGDRVLAVIRGTAVNQDGRTDGIMAPSGPAQAHVARQALRRAGIDAGTVGYVEAHGTGTRAGDPIEAAALASVYGVGRPAGQPCLIGSIKGSVGHLEAGAGVAGILKAVLCLRHGEIPLTAGYTTPNPDIPWREHGLKVVDAPTPFPGFSGPRRAAVSSFGYGGTVGHIVLEQAPEPQREPTGAIAAAASVDPASVFPISAGSAAALSEYAARLADWVQAAEPELTNLGYTLAARRSHLPHRVGVVAADRAELVERLRAAALLGTDDEPPEGVRVGRASPGVRADPVWVFSGHGSQWSGMGAELLHADSVFAAAVDEIAPIFLAEMGFSPREVLESGDLGGVDIIQPMIFTMQVALAASLRARGYRPAAVIGHSVGEIAAAAVAGVFGPADAARLVSRRSVLLRRVAGRGAMAMVGLPFADVAARLADRTDVVAAIESSSLSSVIAGAPEPLQAFCAELSDAGVRVRPVDSDVAFHSPQMDELLDELAGVTAALVPAAPTVPVYSTALDDPRTQVRRDGRYWSANLRNPVRLNTAINAALSDGHRLFLELAPHPVVTHSISETLGDAGLANAAAIGTLRRNHPEWTTLQANLAELYCAGGPPGQRPNGRRGAVLTLPPIAWQHRTIWRSPTPLGADARGHDPASETLLGSRTAVAGAPMLRLWQTELDFDRRPYSGTHPIHGVEIVPAAVLLSTFLAAGDSRELTDVALVAAVPVNVARQVQVVTDGDTVRLASRLVDRAAESGADSWHLHTRARFAPGRFPIESGFNLAEVRSRCATLRDPGAVLRHLHAVGVAEKGFPWQVTELGVGDREVLATVVADPDRDEPSPHWGSLFDAVFTVVPLLYPGEPVLRMPSAIRRLAVAEQAPPKAVAYARLTEDPNVGSAVDIVVADPTGAVVAQFDGVRYDTLAGDASAVHPRKLIHQPAWTDEVTPAAREAVLRTVALIGAGETARTVAAAVRAAGYAVTELAEPAALAGELDDLDSSDAVLVVADSAGSASVADRAVDSAWTLARTAQLLAGHGGSALPRLWSVTVGQRESATEAGLAQSPVWGLGRVVGGEHPDIWGGLLDLDPAATDLGAAVLPGALRSVGEQNLLSIRDGRLQAARLRKARVPDIIAPDPPTRPGTRVLREGTYLVTGGLGVLGLEVAGWLAGRGARRIVLLSRTGLPARGEWDTVTDPALRERVLAVRRLEAVGVTVRVVAADIIDRDQVAAALAPDRLDLPPIRGVVHAAGALDNKMLSDLDLDSLRFVLAPKVTGALVLHELFPVGSLDFLVLFSSIGQYLGLTGQASYASANAFLDALARHREDTTAYAWTSWRGMGMAVSDVVDQELRDQGIGDISAAEAFGTWEYADGFGLPNAVVLRTTGLDSGSRPLPVLRDLEFDAASTATDQVGEPSLPTDPAELSTVLLTGVAADVGAELGIAADELDPDRPLAELGIDSVMTLSIRRRIERRVRLKLPATLLWNHPTIAAVVALLVDRLLAAEAADLTGVQD